MGGVSAASGAGHAWLAKVLAGDPLACTVLALARSLPDAEWDAFAWRVEQVVVGVSPPATTAAVRQEVAGR